MIFCAREIGNVLCFLARKRKARRLSRFDSCRAHFYVRAAKRPGEGEIDTNTAARKAINKAGAELL